LPQTTTASPILAPLAQHAQSTDNTCQLGCRKKTNGRERERWERRATIDKHLRGRKPLKKATAVDSNGDGVKGVVWIHPEQPVLAKDACMHASGLVGSTSMLAVMRDGTTDTCGGRGRNNLSLKFETFCTRTEQAMPLM
jgi:hypothetical protein